MKRKEKKIMYLSRSVTIGPVHGEGGPGQLHLLSGIVGVKRGMQQQGHALHHEGEAAVEQQPHLVPPWQRSGGVPRWLVDEGQSCGREKVVRKMKELR